MTLECRGINPNNLTRFYREPDNLEELTCSLSIKKKDGLLIVFPRKITQNSDLPADVIYFQIKQVKSSVKNTNKTFEATSELENLISNGASISGHGIEKQFGGKVTCRGKKRKSSRPRFIFVQ